MFNNNDKIEKKYIRNFIVYMLIINSIFYINFKIFNNEPNFSPKSGKIKKIKINGGKSIKIGIISDIQLDKESKNNMNKCFPESLYSSLKVFKNNKIDILIIAGDTTNNGQIKNYLYFKEIFYSVYNDIKKPIILSVMGNNDYRDSKFSILEHQKIFYKFMNSYPYSHYMINNYNFIFWSNDNQNTNENGVQKYSWIKSTLENARKNKNKEGDPIFVITHMPPAGTTYGSGKYHKGIFEILKKYPEVICISGHSHYSLKNPKSIWQGDFTVINTQSISYLGLDRIYYNSEDVFSNSAKNNSMGLIAYLNEESVSFDRIEFSTGETFGESWKINFPIEKSNFIYTSDKRNTKIKPIFTGNSEIKIEKVLENNIDEKYIVFDSSTHSDVVHSYKIILKSANKPNNKIELLYYSDYYKNKDLRNKIMKFRLPDIKKGKYNVEIYAIDFFGNISNPKIGFLNL